MIQKVKNVQHKQEKKVFILKITYSQKTMDLSSKGEAEGINQHQKDDAEFVTSDVWFCNRDKERIRNKLIIKYILQGNECPGL